MCDLGQVTKLIYVFFDPCDFPMFSARVKLDDRNKICITVSGTIILLIYLFIFLDLNYFLGEK